MEGHYRNNLEFGTYELFSGRDSLCYYVRPKDSGLSSGGSVRKEEKKKRDFNKDDYSSLRREVPRNVIPHTICIGISTPLPKGTISKKFMKKVFSSKS